MTIIGYARVSTTDQDLSIQEAALRAAGCGVIRAEKRSGTTTEGREELRTVLDFLRKGDVLTFTEGMFHSALHVLRHCSVAVVKEISAGRCGLAYEQRRYPFWTKPRPSSLNCFRVLAHHA
jgi:hypothetical protein